MKYEGLMNEDLHLVSYFEQEEMGYRTKYTVMYSCNRTSIYLLNMFFHKHGNIQSVSSLKRIENEVIENEENEVIIVLLTFLNF